DAVRKRHTAYFATLAEQSEPKLRCAEQMRWLARLDTEQDNFRAALAQSLDTTGNGCDPVAALRVTRGLGWFWWMRGPYGEARRWFSAALAFGQDMPAAIRARALHAAGMMAFAQSDFEEAVRLQEESLALWLELGDPWGIAWERGSVGVAVGRARGDYARRTALIEQALAGVRGRGGAWCTAWGLNALAGLPREGTSPRQVDAMHQEALGLYREVGDAWGTGNALNAVASRCAANGDVDRARCLLDDSVRLLQSIDDKRSLSGVRLSQAVFAQRQGEFARASAYCVESLTLARDVGARL